MCFEVRVPLPYLCHNMGFILFNLSIFLFFLPQKTASLSVLSDLLKCCRLSSCIWNNSMHDINVSFCGLCKLFIEILPSFVARWLQKEQLKHYTSNT